MYHFELYRCIVHITKNKVASSVMVHLFMKPDRKWNCHEICIAPAELPLFLNLSRDTIGVPYNSTV